MKRGLIGVLAIVMLLSTVGMTGAAAASQDTCYGADDGVSVNGGEQTGRFASPSASDAFNFPIPQGQYVEVTIRLNQPERAVSPEVDVEAEGTVEARGIKGGDGDTVIQTDFRSDIDGYEIPGPEANFELWGVTDNEEVCVEIGAPDWERPYGYVIEFERSNPDVTLFEVRELEDRLTDAQSEITEFEAQIEEKDERISELESQLEDANVTIEEKEERISELESQLEDTNVTIEEKDERISELESQLEDANVTIDVSVEPAGQASFSAGSEMAVDVDAQGTPAADVTLGFAGEEYTPTGGDTTIPMEEAGTQQLTVEYEDTTETMTLDVEPGDEDPDTDNGDSTDTPSDDDSTETNPDDDPVESDPDDGTTGGDESGSDGSGPGFGVGGALAGLGGAGYLLKRRFDDENRE